VENIDNAVPLEN